MIHIYAAETHHDRIIKDREDLIFALTMYFRALDTQPDVRDDGKEVRNRLEDLRALYNRTIGD